MQLNYVSLPNVKWVQNRERIQLHHLHVLYYKKVACQKESNGERVYGM